MKLDRTVFLAWAACLAALPAAALKDPDRDPVDLEAVKKEALLHFCKYMKRQNPHIREWKKGELPTEKELKALFRKHPRLEKEFQRVVSEFYREVETDEKKREKFRKKAKFKKR